MAVPMCPVHHAPMMEPRNGRGNYFCPQRDPSKPKGYCDQRAPFVPDAPAPTHGAIPPGTQSPGYAAPPPTTIRMINEGVVSGADIVRFERLASACLEVSAKLFCGEGNLDPSWHDKVTSQAIVMFRAMRDEIEILP